MNKKGNVEKRKITKENRKGEDYMRELNTLNNPDAVWAYATENTKVNENGQPLISRNDDDFNDNTWDNE